MGGAIRGRVGASGEVADRGERRGRYAQVGLARRALSADAVGDAGGRRARAGATP